MIINRFNSHAILLISFALLCLITFEQKKINALPAIVSRATDSLAALLTSGRSAVATPAASVAPLQSQPQLQPQAQQQLPQQSIESAQQQQQLPASNNINNSSLNGEEQQQAKALASINNSNNSNLNSNSNSLLQAHLSAIQTQAQRQINQLNAAVLNGANQLVNNKPSLSNLTQATGAKYGNVLEVLSNVGKAIHQQIMGSNGQIQIITSPANNNNNLHHSNSLPSAILSPIGAGDLANTKKNEYQSIIVNDNQQFNPATTQAINATNQREQSELLRQDIVRRVGQLQQLVTSSIDVLKNNGDLIVRRLLEQLNHRLDQAKSKADKIINEPATSEMGTRALFTINQGLNNLNNIITNIVNRLDITSKEAIQQHMNNINLFQQQQQQTSGRNGQQSQTLLDPNRIRQNLQQLGQQFSSAISAAQQQRYQQAAAAPQVQKN